MRKDAVYTLLLNTTLFKGMKCSYAPQDQRYLRFSTFDRAGIPTHYNLRVSVTYPFHGLSFTRSVLIDVWVSLRTRSWLVNCWMRSSSTSLNWSPDRIVIITTIFSLYFQPYFSFFSSCHSWDHNQ